MHLAPGFQLLPLTEVKGPNRGIFKKLRILEMGIWDLMGLPLIYHCSANYVLKLVM